MKTQHLSQLRSAQKAWIDELGALCTELFHYVALFIIGLSVVWSAVHAFTGMLSNGHATIGDILLLFIYLELGAMVGIYFQTSAMPVRCLIFIAITALSRLLIADIQEHHQGDVSIVLISAAILLLSVSSFLIAKKSNPL